MSRTVYLDNNATTMIAPEVVAAMQPYLTDFYGNPSSMHSFGGGVRRQVDQARASVAALFNATPEEIIFTAGGSEGDNQAILGTLELLPSNKRHFITTRVEHPAVREVGHYLRDQRGYRLTELPVDSDGALDLEQLERSIAEDTGLISVMWANNETGVIFPIEKIAAIAKARGVLFHTDAVQVAGKLPIDLKKIPVDLLSMSGHKIHAPKGIGALYVREGTKINPLIHGGHQENGKRAGTENVPGIIGLGRAAELALDGMSEESGRVRALRDRLEKGLLASCTDSRVNGRNRLHNTLNVSFEFIEGESILLMLDEYGICASSGSACASGSLEPSYVLRALGIPFTAVHGSIRFSLSRYTTDEDIDAVLERMPGIVDRLREISPFVQKEA
ncbi:cysteine desulfurase NifS [bacterium]|nr:cysteine desulfurase NifS [bacterium]